MATISVDKKLPPVFALRDGDTKECLAAGLTPAEAVTHSVKLSDDYFVIRADSQMVAVWGYASESLFNFRCHAWLLTTPLLEEFRLRFIRSSLRVLGFLFSRFDEIEVTVHKEYAEAITWLKWLGFYIETSTDKFHTMVAKKESARWVS